MKAIKAILSAILLGLSPMLLLANFELPVDGEIIVPMEELNGLVIFEATINSQKAKFILDTGADAFLLDHKVSESNISAAAQFTSLNNSINSQKVLINSFNLGGVQHSNLEAFTADLSELESYIGNDIAGVVGFNFFLPNTLTIDFDKNIITISNGPLEKIASDLSVFDFKMIDDIPVAKVFLDNKKYFFALDSGASIHIVDQKIVNKFPSLFKENLESVDLVTASGKTKNLSKFSCEEMYVSKNALGSIQMIAQDFTSINDALSQNISGILSLSSLSRSKIIIQTLSNKVYFN